MTRIEWTSKAYKQLRKIKNRQTESTIYEAVGELAAWPNCLNVKRLIDHQYQYRLRVGNYRVFFDVVGGTVIIVTVQEVKKRDERTY